MMGAFRLTAYVKQSREEVRQPAAAWRMMGICFLYSFAMFVTTQIVLEYIHNHYLLNDRLMGNLLNIFNATLGLGQLMVAWLADRYLGVLRAFRWGILVAILSLLSIFWVMSSDAPRLIYQDKQYEIRTVEQDAQTTQYLVIDGRAQEMRVQADGQLMLVGEKAGAVPALLPAGQWHLSSSDSPIENVVIVYMLAIFLMALCFGPPLIYSLLGNIYPQRDNARVMGFMVLHIFINAGIFTAMGSRFFLFEAIGRKGTLLAAAFALMLAGYLVLKERGQFENLPNVIKRDMAYVPYPVMAVLALIFAFLIFLFGNFIHNVHGGVPEVATGGWVDRIIVHTLNLDGLMVFYALAISYLLLRALFYERREDFFAILCVVILSLLRMIYECLYNIGAGNFMLLSNEYVDLSHWMALGLTNAHLPMLNPGVIWSIGGLCVVAWLRLRHNFASTSELVKSFVAYAMVGSSYLILSIGTHDLDAQMHMPFTYFALAAALIPLAELLVLPALLAATYRLRENRMPATALALFGLSSCFSTLISEAFVRTTQMQTVQPLVGDVAATQKAFGNAFLTTGTLGLVSAMFVFFALLPLFTRWMGIANGPRPPRREYQLTGFDHH